MTSNWFTSTELPAGDYRAWILTSPTPGQLATIFEASVRGNYGTFIVDSATGIITDVVDPGNEGNVEILRVTVSDGTRSLMSLFTN